MAPVITVLFSCGGTLYQYAGEESDRPYYDALGEADAFTITIEKRRASSKADAAVAYVIVVAEDDEVVFEQPLGVELQLSYSADAASVHWPALIEGELETVAFRFSAPAERARDVTPAMYMQRFVALYNECTYSLLTGYDEVDKDDEWFRYLGSAATHEIVNEDASAPAFEFDAARMAMAGTGTGNVCAADSMRFDRVLVVKKSNEATSLEMQSVPLMERGFNSAGAEKLVVHGVDGTTTGSLLEDGDLKMLLFGGKSAAVQQLDLSTGTVVQQYKPQDLDIQSVSYANHTSADSGAVYTCLSRNVAFNIDTRINPRSCVVMEDGKLPTDYALSSLKKDFSCHATSRNGHLVICDGSGNIRLYSGPPGARKPAGGYFPKTAKTLLEAKTPIVHVDVTADGRYIVATTAQFLLFIDTTYVDAKDKTLTGFEGRMGAQKPQPVILQPSPAQTLQMGGAANVRFHSATFDRFPGTEELCVTASCLDVVMSWSLRAIEASQRSGRAVVNSAVTVGQVVLSTSANRADQVGFLTGDDVGMVPFQETQKKVSSAWTWGQGK